MKKHRFLFTGGGTGGHVYPNIAVYEALVEKYPDAEFLYVGTRRGSEAAIVPALSQPMEFASVPARGLPTRLRSPRTLLALAAILAGTVKAFFILLRFRPDLVIGSGGYAAAPVLLAAALLKKRIFIHEQNAVPGRLNLFVARYATRIGIAFPSTAFFFRRSQTVVTGYPLRRAILRPSGVNGREKFAIPAGRRVLFICSGSTGARTINRAAAAAIPRLLSLPNLFVIMSTGKGYSKEYKAYDDTVTLLEKAGFPAQIEGRLLVHEYFDPIAEIYDLSDLVISRAGAGAVQEIAAKVLPSILVPKIDLPGDHQVLNARELEKTGGARVLYEEVGGGPRRVEITLSPDNLYGAVAELLADPERLAAMRRNLQALERPDATAAVIAAVEDIVEKKGAPSEREVEVFYLHALKEEKNLELPFPRTRVGNTALDDVRLEGGKDPLRFEVRFLAGERSEAVIRPRRGRLRLNDREIRGWVPLKSDDRLTAGEHSYIFRSTREKSSDDARETPEAVAAEPSSASITTQAIGFGRDVVAAALFGAGRVMDLFVAALTITGFLRRPLGRGGMRAAFLPLFSRLFKRGPRQKAWEAA
ncbi:MAG: glycosyltransferase, partial [Candidatus Aminicenantes bacterium]|nr:glycosyltransferase [Candidatus Aminicenantes bacterium]